MDSDFPSSTPLPLTDIVRPESRERVRERGLSPEILKLYGDVDIPSESRAFRDIFGGFKKFLNKRVYGFNKSPRSYLASLFPLINRLRNYKIEWIRKDFLAGLIVGMMQFTQVLGNSQTASLKPEIGLAILFFPGLVYALMASSMHNSLGGMPITAATLSVSLMNIQDTFYPEQKFPDGTVMTDEEQLDLHSTMAPGVAFVAGFVQVAMGLFKLGFLSAVLSPNVLEPFTIACFLQSICGKIPSVLGLYPPVHFTYAKHFRDIIFTFGHINQINGWEVLMSFSMATVVLIFREYLQPRIFQRIRIVIPIEFIVFVFFTALSYGLDLQNVARIRIIGCYDYGLPRGSWPDLSYGWQMIWSGIVVGLVSYSTSLETAKVLARRSEVALSANQELLALGSAHIFSSFFSCYPCGAPMGRGLVNESMGSQSQVSTLFACIFAGLVVGFAGPAIKYLPVCILSTNMILFLSMSLSGFKEVSNLWRSNKVDGAIWILTLVGCVTLNVQIGLFLGIGLSVLSLIVRSQKPKVRVMGILNNTQWAFAALKHYDTANEFLGVRILQLQSPLIYATADHLVKEIVEKALEPYLGNANLPTLEVLSTSKRSGNSSGMLLSAKSNPAIRALTSSNTLASLGGLSTTPLDLPDFSQKPQRPSASTGLAQLESSLTLHSLRENLSAGTISANPQRASRVVLDLGSMGYIDSVGIRALEQIASDLKGQKVEAILAQCTAPLLKQLKELQIHQIIPERNIFPSLADAVENALRRNEIHTSPAEGVVGEYEDDRFWDVPAVPVEGLPVVDYNQD